MFRTINIFALVILGAVTAMAIQFPSIFQSQKKIALIYKGPGSCEASPTTTGCSEASANVAKSLGYKVVYVGPNEKSAKIFEKASVWIMPGGSARIQAQTISPELKQNIINYVKNGGAYVGFCAGGFMATEKFGWDTEKGPFEADGLGLLPGKSWYYESFDEELSETLLAKILKVNWNGSEKYVYWELGPYFTPDTQAAGSVLAYYHDLKTGEPILDKAMTLQASVGKGRVSITAVHPEAPEDWRGYYKVQDQDGVDFKLAQDMITWATAKSIK